MDDSVLERVMQVCRSSGRRISRGSGFGSGHESSLSLGSCHVSTDSGSKSGSHRGSRRASGSWSGLGLS